MKGNTHSDPVRVEQVLGILVLSWLDLVAGWVRVETINELRMTRFIMMKTWM